MNCKVPLISFIVTADNLTADMVRECVGSITGLSLRPAEREIVIVDDGSATGFVDSLGDVRDKLVYIRQRRQGTGAARNLGLRVATGRYIQFMDGADRLIQEGYEHCIDIVRYNDADMVLFDSSDRERVGNTYYIPEPVDGAAFMRNNTLPAVAWGYVFNRRILLDLRFTPGRIGEDEEFTPQLFLRAESVYSTNIAAYCRRKHGGPGRVSRDKRLVLKRLNDMEQIIYHLNDVSAALPRIDFQAMQRRVAQLTLEYIFQIIRLTGSRRQLDERLARLESQGLFPLPDKDYTRKYMLMRKLVKNKLMRRMLFLFK